MTVITGGASSGSVDLSTTVILTPTSSTRNVITPSGDYVPLTIRAASGQTANPFEIWDSNNTSSIKFSLNGGGSTGYNKITCTSQATIGTASEFLVINANGSKSLNSNGIPNFVVNTSSTITGLPIVFSSTAYVGIGNNDVGLKYSASGILKVTNGSTGYGSLILGAYTSSTVGLTVVGAASQSSDVVLVQDSSSNSRIVVASDYAFKVLLANGTQLLNVSTSNQINSYYGYVVNSNSTRMADSGIDMKAANTITWWSGATIGTGSIDVGLARSAAGILKVTDASTGLGSLIVGAYSASTVALTVKAATSQTANIQEWQNSSSVAQSLVNKNGVIKNRARQTFTSSSAASTFDCDVANSQSAVLTESTTLTVSNARDGETYLWVIEQGGSGSYTVTWPATFLWSGGSAPTLSTTVGKIDIVTFVYHATNNKFYASATTNF